MIHALRTIAWVTLIGLNIPAGSPAFGQSAASKPPEYSEEPNWQALCAGAVATPLPAAAAAIALAARVESAPAAGECNEQALYYGFGKPPDYEAALRCAYRHRAHPDSRTGGFLDGAGTLAMLYANGKGVARSYDLAIRFACELDSRGGQNTEQRIGRLEALRDSNPPSAALFDLCDGQMSGAMGAYCSDLDGKKADVGRARRIQAIEKRLPERARAMLPNLQAAETAFEQARLRGEYTGGGGSGSAGFALDDQGRLREQFVINLERFGEGKLPRATAADRDRAERKLSDASGAAQSAWQSLFQEWMRFVPIAYPNLSQDAAATELIRLRIHQLARAAPNL